MKKGKYLKDGKKLSCQAIGFFLLTWILFLPGRIFPSWQAEEEKSSLQQIVKNYEYLLDDGSKYKLQDGHYQQGKSIDDFVDIRLDSAAFGDLNNDGRPDAAVILVANYGGSGSFYTLTALVNEGKGFSQTNNLELGDRVNIKKLEIAQGKIKIDMLTHGPNDPSCCPSKKAILFFKLINGQLSEMKK